MVYKIDRLSPLADGLRQAGRGVRPQRRHLRLGHPVVQHHDLDGPAHAEHPALLRPVRARGHRRAHPGQVRGLPAERHVDGRLGAARLRRQGPEAGGQPTSEAADRPLDLRALRPDRLGDDAGAGADGGGRSQPRRAAARQGPLYKLLNNRVYIGMRSTRARLSGRARGDRRPRPLGQGARDPRRERPHRRRSRRRSSTSCAASFGSRRSSSAPGARYGPSRTTSPRTRRARR